MIYRDILDPRTGSPAADARSVTALHRSAATAEDAAAAPFVAGPVAWVGLARTLGVRSALLTDSSGTVHASPELYERLELVEH